MALLQHQSQTLSERVCRPCGLKIRNAAELYNFIKRYVFSDRPEDENIEDVEQDDGDDGRRKWYLENPVIHSPRLQMNFEETKTVKSYFSSSLSSLLGFWVVKSFFFRSSCSPSAISQFLGNWYFAKWLNHVSVMAYW